MKDNRNRWMFIKHPTKQPLTSEEVRYWKDMLLRLIKVGQEYEFNLQRNLGDCRGNSPLCTCKKINDENHVCWEECLNTEVCKTTPTYYLCGNRIDKCKQTDCTKCNNYKFECVGIMCLAFISKCYTCNESTIDCNSCDQFYNPDKEPKNIRIALSDKFLPSHDYAKFNESGVVSVKTDHSLEEDGVEVVTIGKRVDFWEFYKMAKNIIDSVKERGGFLNERCGSHMHILTSHYGREHEKADVERRNFTSDMEKPMPDIIFSNFHQLCRLYQNPITWMTSALDDKNRFTRWEKFRTSILNISPVEHTPESLCKAIFTDAQNSKYGWVNYENMKFVNGSIAAFHAEIRVADSTMCPSYYAALPCLYVAILIKAVEISCYGLLNISGEHNDYWLSHAIRVKEAIMNNRHGSYDGPRFSNTEGAFIYKNYLIEESKNMLSQLKGILIKFGPAYDVLLKLADKPPSMRRIEGQAWEQIEEDLKPKVEEYNDVIHKFQEIIHLNIVEECSTLSEWVDVVTSILSEEFMGKQVVCKDDVMNFTELKMRDGMVIWSDRIGSVVAV